MTANYCGTGLDEYVPPGDPTLGSPILSARAVWPGVQLTWTYPNVNPEGVAHTKVYRSRSSNFGSAVQLAIAEGGYYFDQEPANVDIRFYYWIRMISVNGTVGPVIGPASVVKNPTVDYIIDELTGQLNNSHLNDELNSSIDQITDNTSGLSDLKQEQLFGDAVLSAMWDDLRAALDANENAIFEVRTESVTQDEVLLQTINGMTANLDGNLAEYGELIQVLVASDAAQTAKIESLTASVGNNTAAIAVETIARVDGDEELDEDIKIVAARVTTLEANTDPSDPNSDYAQLQQQMIVVAGKADDAQETADDAQDAAETADAKAVAADAKATKATQDAVAAQDDANQAIDDASDAFNKASGAEITANNADTKAGNAQNTANNAQGDVNDLEATTYALYTLKSDVNGLVSGFGSYNDGFTSSFIVHANTFGIGFPTVGPNKPTVYPFIVGQVDGQAVIALNGATMITDAAITSAKIKDAAVETLKIGGNAVTVPEGESGYISKTIGNSWTELDEGWNEVGFWAYQQGPAAIIIAAQVSFSGNASGDGGGNDGWIDWDPNNPYPFPFPYEETFNSSLRYGPAGPGTIGVKVLIEWYTQQGTWTVGGNTYSDSTRSWSSCADGYGGCVVSNTNVIPPTWTFGMRTRICGLNRPAQANGTREATRYGYFCLGAKR